MALLLAGNGSAQSLVQPEIHELTSVGQILHLSREEAARAHPVGVRGRIVFSFGSSSYALQSGRTGILVANGRGDVQPGDEVEIRGITQAGGYAPSIRPSFVRKLGSPGLPKPVPVDESALALGRYENVRIEFRAQVVDAVTRSPQELTSSPLATKASRQREGQTELVLRSELTGRQYRAIIEEPVFPAPGHLVEAWVRVVGIGGVDSNQDAQYLGPLLRVNSLRDVVVGKPAPKDPFARRTTPLDQLLQHATLGHGESRVKIRGVVSLARAAGVFFLEDQGRGIAVNFREGRTVIAGDVVEAVGFPKPGLRTPQLVHAVFRVTNRTSPPEPQDMTPVQALSDAAGSRLVRVEGALVSSQMRSGVISLSMQAGNRPFEAEIPAGGSAPNIPRNGSWLRLTGVCQLLAKPGDLSATGFRLLARGLNDVRVLREPPVWTSPEFSAGLTGALGGVALGSAVVLLRRRRAGGRHQPAPQAAGDSGGQAKAELLASMSHELRTPLHGLLGMAHLALAGNVEAEPKSHLESASRAAQSLLTLLNDLSEITGGEPGEVKLDSVEFDPMDLVAKVVRPLAFLAHGKEQELIVDIASDVPARLSGDLTRLEWVLANLLGNAVKFTEAGEVELEVRTLTCTAGAATLEFKVTDTGIGMGPEQLNQIRTIFEQDERYATKSTTRTGLGLSLSAKLCRIMGGRLTVESHLGTGTTFSFEVPLRCVSGPRSYAKLADSRLLLIEPHRTARGVLERLCQEWGLRVTAVANAAEALVTLGQETFDLAVVSSRLPDASARAFARSLEKAHGRIPIVLLIPATDAPPDETACHQMSVVRCIAKAVIGPDLREAIEQALRGGSPRRPDLTEPPPLSRPLKILLAEDNTVNQIVAARMLRRAGHDVSIAANGKVALEYATANAYDVILMDLQMPEIDGIEATRLIRRHEASAGGHVPIVALTAHAMKTDRERCLAAGMDDYLAKPFSTDALLSKVESVASLKNSAGGPGRL